MVFWLDWFQVSILAALVLGVGVILYRQGRVLMATYEDVVAAINALKTEVGEEVAHIKAQNQKILDLIAAGGASPEQLQGIVDELTAATSALDTAAAETPIPGAEPPPTP